VRGWGRSARDVGGLGIMLLAGGLLTSVLGLVAMSYILLVKWASVWTYGANLWIYGANLVGAAANCCLWAITLYVAKAGRNRADPYTPARRAFVGTGAAMGVLVMLLLIVVPSAAGWRDCMRPPTETLSATTDDWEGYCFCGAFLPEDVRIPECDCGVCRGNRIVNAMERGLALRPVHGTQILVREAWMLVDERQ
jgi:hypothetical protein